MVQIKRKGEEGTLALLGDVLFSLKFLYQYLLKDVVLSVCEFLFY